MIGPENYEVPFNLSSKIKENLIFNYNKRFKSRPFIISYEELDNLYFEISMELNVLNKDHLLWNN